MKSSAAISNSLVTVACPLCGGKEYRVLFRRPDHTYQISSIAFCVVRCLQCSMVFVNPRPSKEFLDDFYPEQFFGVTRDARAVLLEQAESMQQKWKLLARFPPGRLLDIGCQKGDFLLFMQSRGWVVDGVEISSKSPNVFGQRIHYGSLESAGYPKHSFDLITMWAVLEHLAEPQKMLRSLRPLLRPGGRLVVLVPNFFSLPGRLMRHDDIPRHLLLFTPFTLRKMLRKCGWELHTLHFNHILFGGWNRGVLTYLFKWFAGEKFPEIVAQNRIFKRWNEFSTSLFAVSSPWVEWVDEWDKKLTPWLDCFFDRLGLGFTMIAEVVPRLDEGTSNKEVKI